ncbi:MAG TPA: alcohol dehydrogenase catalytic domain-containing protein [Candidatus Limnocylindria bacterium]|jgi:L-iditol 2-dehydrogenase|nr:alcohol dehydrogenase catalytic domain-containing protein [Candidatus Limnocylindria bacterium]
MKNAVREAARSGPLPATMRAVVFVRPNEFAVREVSTPRAGDREVLVRVRASMVCASDAKILAGRFPGTRFPHVPGHEFAGEIVASSDERFPAGARVGVEVHVGCGTCERCREGMYTLCLNYGRREMGHAHVGFTIGGGLAEYAAVPVAALHVLPEEVTFEQGAWTDNIGVALWALERGRLQAGERVVVIGPGAIGLCAAQLARALGAGRVTLVGRGGRLARVRDMADEVIDAAGLDPMRGTADLVIEFAGTADAARDAIGLARRGGRVVLGGATGTGVELSGVDLSTIVRGNLDVLGSLANPKGVSGRALTLLAEGKVDVTTLVTHHYPLDAFEAAWRTFTERRDGAIRVMLHPDGTT